jgi:peptide/nickel transport system substrate-binding protein
MADNTKAGFRWHGIAAFLLATTFCTGAAPPASAATLTYAGTAPPLTFDPHGTNDFATMAVFRQVYDSLVALNANIEPVPGLAAAWEPQGDHTWRFHLRDGVLFHDGSKLSADDVVFSVLREKGSGFYSSLFGGITEARAVDPLTVDIVSKDPDPILPQKLARMFVMSKAWSLVHDLQNIPNLGAQGAEAYSVRHANGTGPMMLESQEPGVRTVLRKFDHYWGKADGNLTEAVYLPIGTSATRVAALLSGQVDLITDLPLQDVDRVKNTPGFAVHEVPQLLWMQLEMDGTRDVALNTWDKDGQPLKSNPFKDVRVRTAIAQTVDAKLMVDRVLRGAGRVVGVYALPGTEGYVASQDTRWPTDPAHAKALLAEAGYPNGFVTQLNCPVERYALAEDVCRATASMLGRIGIEVRVNTMVWPEFARMLVNGPSSSFHLIGVASTFGAQDVFVSEMMTRDPKSGEGFFNWALWHNDKLDAIARELRVTFDQKRRDQLSYDGLEVGKDNVYAVTLYQPMLIWASKANVNATLRADSTLLLQDASVK